MLVRRFVNASFVLLIENQWAPPLCREYNAILLSAAGPLWCVVTQSIIDRPFEIADKSLRYRSPSDPRAPQGLAYHLTETWLTELEKALAAVASQKPVPMRLVFEPFLTFAAKTPNKVTYKQIEANLVDPLLTALAPSPVLTDELPQSNRLKTSSGGDDLPNLLANSCLSPQNEPLDRSQLRKGLLEYIFEVASQEGSRDSNRRKLYAICNANINEDDDA